MTELGGIRYLDLTSTGIEDLTSLKPVNIPAVDGIDPYSPDTYKPSSDSTLTEDKLQPDPLKEAREELNKAFGGLFRLFTTPGDVLKEKKPMTQEELVSKAVDMAETILGRQIASGYKSPRLYQKTKDLPRPPANVMY